MQRWYVILLSLVSRCVAAACNATLTSSLEGGMGMRAHGKLLVIQAAEAAEAAAEAAAAEAAAAPPAPPAVKQASSQV